MLVTDNGATFVEVDLAPASQVREDWEFHRDAADITPKKRGGAAKSKNTWPVPGGAWLLRPASFDRTALTTTEYEPSVIGQSAVNVASGIASYFTFKRPDDLVGIAPDVSVVAQGVTAFQKRVEASGLGWAVAQLLGDVAGFPKPFVEDPTPLIPTDRVLVGTETHGPNDGYSLLWGQSGWDPPDVPMTFYFGGLTQVKEPNGSSSEQTGGQYCLAFRGGGMATLFEKDRDVWEPRDEMRYAAPDESGEHHTVWIIPYRTNNLVLACNSAPMGPMTDTGGFTHLLGFLGGIAAVAAKGLRGLAFDYYKEQRFAAGHYHVRHMTGSGVVRADIQRDFRGPFMISRIKYPLEGTVTDAPFLMPFTLPTGTPMTLVVHKWLLTGTEITGQLYNADTHAALVQDGQGRFLSHANQRKYYVKLTLTCDADHRYSTPVLEGYTVKAPGQVNVRVVSPYQAWVEETNVQTPDWNPGQDQAVLKVQDLDGTALTVLAIRDHIHSRVGLKNPTTGAVITYLHEGETVQPVARRRGIPGDVFPSANWREYNPLRIGSLWGRIERKYSLQMHYLSEDQDSPVVDGKHLPEKLTDTARWAFNQAGVPNSQLDIPDLSLRWWTTHDSKATDLKVTVGQPLAPLLQSIAQDFLGGTWIRDPNAGPDGMWRLIREPGFPYTNYLAHFHLTSPLGPGQIETFPYSYPAGHTFIEAGTYNSFVRAPEGNSVIVFGITPGVGLINAFVWNWFGLNDPTHPDFMEEGHCPIIRFADPGLQTVQACNWVASMIYRQACHAQKCFEFQAPLVLVVNSLDPLQVRPRPLRIGDLVLVQGNAAMIRNVHINYDSDYIQMATYEGRFLT